MTMHRLTPSVFGLVACALLVACGGEETDAAFDDVGAYEGAIADAAPNSTLPSAATVQVGAAAIAATTAPVTPVAPVAYVAITPVVATRSDSSPDPIPAREVASGRTQPTSGECERNSDLTKRDACRRIVQQLRDQR